MGIFPHIRAASCSCLMAAALVIGAFGGRSTVAQSSIDGQKPSGFTIGFKQFTLENGLRVLLSEDHTAPVVAVAVYYDVGSRNEVRGRSGFAHLFEHMMFQGSENVKKGEHFKYVEGNGGDVNATTHLDYTDFVELLPSNRLALALWLESDRMRSLKITAENLDNQRKAVEEEKRLTIDNQAYWPALDSMDAMVFHNWAISHPTIGSMQDLDAASVSDVQAFFDTYYAPNNAVLAIAGDIDYPEAEGLVRKYFSSLPRHAPPPPVDLSEPAGVAVAARTVDDPHADVPALAMSWKIPPRGSPDSYPIALLKAVLLDGESARLYQELVKDKQLAVQVQGFLDLNRGPSELSIFVTYKPAEKGQDRAGEIERAIEDEITRVKRDGVGDEELEKARNQYRLGRYLSGTQGDEYSSLQTALGRAMALAEFTMFDGDPGLINTDTSRYLAVTRDQIRDAAREYLVPENRAVLKINAAEPGNNATPAEPGKSGSEGSL